MNVPETKMTSETSLMIRRTFDADIETLWSALSDPKAWMEWFGGGHATPQESDADLRPGGAWSVTFRGNDSGNIFRLSGEFIKIEPPERLSFTWAWSFSEDAPSQVTYALSPATDGHTTLTLTHERLSSAELRDQHGRGWNATLDLLVAYLAR